MNLFGAFRQETAFLCFTRTHALQPRYTTETRFSSAVTVRREFERRNISAAGTKKAENSFPNAEFVNTLGVCFVFRWRYMQRRDQLASNGDSKQLQLQKQSWQNNNTRCQTTAIPCIFWAFQGFFITRIKWRTTGTVHLIFGSISPTDFLHSDFSKEL